MEICYKKLTEKELDTFIQMRIRQLREEGAKEDIDLVPALQDYYTRHMADGTFVSWLALDGEKIVGTSGMSFGRSRHILMPERQDGIISVCLQIQITDAKGLQKSFCRESWKRQELWMWNCADNCV